MNRAYFLSLVSLLDAHLLFAAARIEQNLDSDWRFFLGDDAKAKAASFDDSKWRKLDVPHDWSIEGDYDAKNPSTFYCSYLPSGIGWYRRVIEMPDSWKDKTVTLEFDGVYMNSDVWLNGERIGGRKYGYSSFSCDLTKGLKPGRNVVAVRVDNSLEPSARWYHGCGIYGDVRVTATDPVHVPVSGVFLQTPIVTADAAVILAGVELKNDSPIAAEVEVQMEVVNPDSVSVGVARAKMNVAAGETGSVKQEINVKKPMLWSLESPSLYTFKTRLVRASELVDEVTTPFGIRSLKFDANTGFYLNGKNVKIKGVCEHQGGSPLGAAMQEAQLKRRLQQLKEMGCNSIRTAHNPQLPEFYDLCDQMGLLVMDEIFDGWHRKAPQDYGARFFRECWQQDVTDWVRRDRNHPSVIFWSIGNETGNRDTNGIQDFIHKLDTTRPVTGGDVIEGMDVAGFNGRSVKSDRAIQSFHEKHPALPIVLTEEPHTFQTRGFYRTQNQIFEAAEMLPDYADPEVFTGGHSAYRSSYDNVGRRMVARNTWKRTLSLPWVIGEYRWTGFDYLGEAKWAGTESLARAFNFGVLDLAGFPKDHYYFYQSVWSEKPMVHLLPHWTHPGLEVKTIPVVAYANADQVELFQDGKSLGRKPRSDLFECVWQVPYSPGELKAIAYRGQKAVASTSQVTARVPCKLKLTTDNASLKADRNDLALVTIAVCDEHGTLVPNADNRIDLALLGSAHFLGGENGDPVDITPQREPGRKVFAGLSRAFFAGKEGASTPTEVVAIGILGNSYFADTAPVTIALERVALRGALSAEPLQIHYTLDGSIPSPSSPLYTAPLSLKQTTTVRAAIFSNSKLLLQTSGVFTKGTRPASVKSTKPGGEQGEAEDPTQEKSADKKGRRK